MTDTRNSTANFKSAATVLVLGAGGSAAFNFVDALRLANAEYRVVGVDARSEHLHLSNADAKYLGLLPNNPAYLDALNEVCRRESIDVIHAQPDPEVLAVSRNRGDLSARVFLPSRGAIELAADKDQFAEAMLQAGIQSPVSVSFESFEDVAMKVDALLKDFERVWIRARRGAGSKASLPVSTADQAVSWIRWWAKERGMVPSDFMASEILPGREFAYQSVWKGGALVAGQARQRVQYLYGHLTPSGQTSTPSVARTISDSRIDNLAQAAIHALDGEPQGTYCVDIKEDAGGIAKVTEVNAGRFFTTSNFFAHAGLNMPDMLMRCAMGEEVTPVGSSPLPADLYWVRMMDMGFKLVPGEQLDSWPRADRRL